MPSVDSSPNVTVVAEYKSPAASQTFQLSQPILPIDKSSSETTAYLSSLRKSVAQMQDTINEVLTKRMDEDKRAAADHDGTEITIDEQKEEDNYGEEVDDDEA